MRTALLLQHKLWAEQCESHGSLSGATQLHGIKPWCARSDGLTKFHTLSKICMILSPGDSLSSQVAGCMLLSLHCTTVPVCCLLWYSEQVQGLLLTFAWIPRMPPGPCLYVHFAHHNATGESRLFEDPMCAYIVATACVISQSQNSDSRQVSATVRHAKQTVANSRCLLLFVNSAPTCQPVTAIDTASTMGPAGSEYSWPPCPGRPSLTW